MLDTHARQYVQPLFNAAGRVLHQHGIKPNHVTAVALVTGLGSGISFILGYPILATVLLWVSGTLDVLDGSVARLSKTNSPWGGFMDLIFDRTVETAVVISYALVYPDVRMALVVLLSSIVFCISIFLTVGAMAENKGVKEFHHQAGVTERTETFIFFTLFFLFPGYRVFWVYLFAGLIYFTGGQRFLEAYKLFGQRKGDVS